MNKLKQMIVGALAVAGAWCAQAGTVNVSYVDVDGTTKQTNATVAASDQNVLWKAGWYVVNANATITGRLTCSGAINLILADGCTLTVSAGIAVTDSDSLTVYGQETGTGSLIATTTVS